MMHPVRMRVGIPCVAKILILFTSIVMTKLGFSAVVITLDRGGYSLTYDCTNRTALRYDYTLKQDMGTAPRPSSFYLDPDLPQGCGGQFKTSSYTSIQAGWDRGHLVTSNHMDASSELIKRANYMSNIVPQVSTFNQGIWLQAENIAECYRDIAPVRVVGGVVYDDESNDYFLSSHGIRTPDYFWKTILTTDPGTGETQTISWYIPNSPNLGNLDSYIVSIEELEALVGIGMVGINATEMVRTMKPFQSWSLPSQCNLG